VLHWNLKAQNETLVKFIESSFNNTEQTQLTTDIFILGIPNAISSDVSIVTESATEILKEFYNQRILQKDYIKYTK
jgi:hypothetical protein